VQLRPATASARSLPPTLALSLLLAACGAAPEATAASVQPTPAVAAAPVAAAWPEADGLFRQDLQWLGGDAAVSIALDAQRVLWLFGDSFVAQPGAAPASDRRAAAMVRNSIAVQTGRDPRSARMRFVVRDGPASFFPEHGGRWYWPQHGIVLDGALTIFLYALVHDPDSALGFRYDGWTALRVDDPAGDPAGWQLRTLEVSDTSPIAMVGTSVHADAEHVYAYGVREPGDHAVFLLRWRRSAFLAGSLGDPRVWGGASRGWIRGPPQPVLPTGQTEFSIIERPSGGHVLAEALGFGASTVALRFGGAPQGPFGEPVEVHRPSEYEREQILIYGVRAHPEQAGGDLVLTYNVNNLDADRLLDDLSIYFPRFVRVDL